MKHFSWMPMIERVAIAGLLIMLPGLLAGKTLGRSPVPSASPQVSTQKITFDLSRISDAGLVGPPNGLRSLSYEFCIPAHDQTLAEVRAIDPTLQFSRSPGRIHCQRDQYLVIGETHRPNWRSILTQLAQLDYVQRIDEFFGE
jgi:hypothetical protein